MPVVPRLVADTARRCTSDCAGRLESIAYVFDVDSDERAIGLRDVLRSGRSSRLIPGGRWPGCGATDLT